MRLRASLACFLALALAGPACAQERGYDAVMDQAGPLAGQTVTVTEVVEDVVEEDEATVPHTGSGRFVGAPPAQLPRGTASYGPFRVLDGTRAALVGPTDERSPAAFLAMLAAHPGIAMLELVECPGTEDDRANLRLETARHPGRAKLDRPCRTRGHLEFARTYLF